MTLAAESPAPSTSLASAVGRLAGILGSPAFSSRDRSALKRWAPGQDYPLAFYRLWLCRMGEELPAESQQECWMLLSWGLALCGAGAHRPDRPLGKALAQAGYSEMRVERLLGAANELRPELFASMVRFLAAKERAFNWVEAADLLLAKSTDARNRCHRRLAQSFYRHLPKNTDKE